MEFVFNNSTKLKELNREADRQTAQLYADRKYLPLAFSNTDKYEMMNFKGYDYYWDSSAVSGTKKLVYTNTKKDFESKIF